MELVERLEVFLDAEVDRRIAERPPLPTNIDAANGNVRPIRLWLANGWASGTIHLVAVVDGVDIWATAMHVTEGRVLADQLAEYGACYLLRRRGQPDRPDVHFFTHDAEALDKFKASCPAPIEAAAAFGINTNTFYEAATGPIVGQVSGYPHGAVDGRPQTRDLTPFFPDTPDLRGLLWFYVPDPVVPGMSGGLLVDNEGGNSRGVLVATAGRERQFFALAQPFHNQMALDTV